MKQYVYQLSLRKADDNKKKFIIESDIIFTNDKISQEKAEEIKEKNNCDVFVQYLGYLVQPKTPEKAISVLYNTQQDIENKINEWRKPEQEHSNESNG